MTLLRQRDLSEEDMQMALGRKLPRGRGPNAQRRHGVTVDEDGETSSLTTLLEQSRERFDQAMSLSGLVSGNDEM